MSKGIKAIDRTTIHQITSGQVVIDLQNAVKELLENSMDAGATNIGESLIVFRRGEQLLNTIPEIRFKQYGLKTIEVIDNGCGIAEEDYDNIGTHACVPVPYLC